MNEMECKDKRLAEWIKDPMVRLTDKGIEFSLWMGEFGWEIMTWIPWIRKRSRGYHEIQVTAHAPRSTGILYADFAGTIHFHDDPKRGLDYPKRYRIDGEYHQYGRPRTDWDILIHARGISRKSAINYHQFNDIIPQLNGLKVACIGTKEDQKIADCWDLRGIDIAELTDYMAGCAAVVGVSSGLMHLAALCGANMVVWGDRRIYFGETLEQRYKHTWNPFGVQVRWIDVDNWRPKPSRIIKEIESLL